MTTTAKDAIPGLRDRDDLCVGGRREPSTGARTLDVVDPATEETVASIREASVTDIDHAVRAARSAMDGGAWSGLEPAARAVALEAMADRLESRATALSELITTEGGMPLSFSRASVVRAVGSIRYFAELARSMPFQAERRRADGATTRILREPVGVVAAITPWNGPLGTAALKLAPALAAGCAVILKPAVETPLATMVLGDVICDLVDEGALPEGVVSVIPCDRDIAQSLVDHPGVDKISFTGSTQAGRHIMASAAARIGRVTLELGGKSAAIILDDAPFDAVLPSLVMGGCGNSGQMCFALTRVLISVDRHDEFLDAMAAAMGALVVGDPRDPATMIGPLATARQRERVESYIKLGRAEGARTVIGGGRPAGRERGYYMEPTLFAGIRNSMRVAQEEIFGPVISVITYNDADEAVSIANDSIFGLAGSIYTADVEAGYELARRVRTGTISVNAAVFDTTTPFGGFKQSGIGREGGPEGVEIYTELKSVHLPV
jgi:acyl-CoA reductase-like NAD-dependent aldehyde dehydrogenase